MDKTESAKRYCETCFAKKNVQFVEGIDCNIQAILDNMDGLKVYSLDLNIPDRKPERMGNFVCPHEAWGYADWLNSVINVSVE